MKRATSRLKAQRPLALVTGAAGFAGSYLVERLQKANIPVIATVNHAEKLGNLDALSHYPTIERLDLTRPQEVKKIIGRHSPAWIFHLGAMASVGGSFAAEKLTYEVNFLGTLNIFEAARAISDLKKIVVISSADAYGDFPQTKKKLSKNKLFESQPLNPISPYGVSKVAVEHLAQFHLRQYGLPITIARPFNHTGPRQDERFVIPSFCRQIALIEAGRQEPIIAVGDLSARRDIGDVRDVVRGYVALARHGRPGQAYHLSTGRAVSVRAMLKTLLELSTCDIETRIDPTRLRKIDIPVLCGDNRKASKELDWKPRYTLHETLVATLGFWRLWASQSSKATTRRRRSGH